MPVFGLKSSPGCLPSVYLPFGFEQSNPACLEHVRHATAPSTNVWVVMWEANHHHWMCESFQTRPALPLLRLKGACMSAAYTDLSLDTLDADSILLYWRNWLVWPLVCFKAQLIPHTRPCCCCYSNRKFKLITRKFSMHTSWKAFFLRGESNLLH